MSEKDNEKNSQNEAAAADAADPKNLENSIDDSQKQIIELKKALDKAKSDHLYLLAEFDNYRKNAIKDRSDLLKYGHERLARDLVATLDNFDRALAMEVTAENFKQFVDGMKMTAQELTSLLQKNGIEEIPSHNKAFNPAHHEALSSEPTDKVEPGTITQVFSKPYKIHDRILRPGQVVVATELVKPS